MQEESRRFPICIDLITIHYYWFIHMLEQVCGTVYNHIEFIVLVPGVYLYFCQRGFELI